MRIRQKGQMCNILCSVLLTHYDDQDGGTFMYKVQKSKVSSYYQLYISTSRDIMCLVVYIHLFVLFQPVQLQLIAVDILAQFSEYLSKIQSYLQVFSF